MKFEDAIKNISSIIALVVVYLISAGMYLSAKGFIIQGDGEVVLVNRAYAQDSVAPKEIPSDLVLPEDHVLGKANAPLTIYEYSSFGCSHCADFHLQTLPAIVQKYVSAGEVRVVFVPFPIDKSSMDAALLAECVAPEQYFSFADVLFKKQRDWSLARNPQKVLKQYAALSGVSAEQAESCLHNDNAAQKILENRQNGITQLGIQGTPSFIVSFDGKRELIAGTVSEDYIEDLLTDGIFDDVEEDTSQKKSEEAKN